MKITSNTLPNGNILFACEDVVENKQLITHVAIEPAMLYQNHSQIAFLFQEIYKKFIAERDKLMLDYLENQITNDLMYAGPTPNHSEYNEGSIYP